MPLHHFSRRGCRYYIQSALSLDTDEKREQEKRSLRLIGDSFKKIVVVNKVMKPYMDDDGMGVRTFLWTGYAASPRLLRYCIGLIQPSPSFGRPSL